MKNKLIIFQTCFFISHYFINAQSAYRNEVDLVNVTFQILDDYSNDIWNDWKGTYFPVRLNYPSGAEILVNFPEMIDGYEVIEKQNNILIKKGAYSFPRTNYSMGASVSQLNGRTIIDANFEKTNATDTTLSTTKEYQLLTLIHEAHHIFQINRNYLRNQIPVRERSPLELALLQAEGEALMAAKSSIDHKEMIRLIQDFLFFRRIRINSPNLTVSSGQEINEGISFYCQYKVIDHLPLDNNYNVDLQILIKLKDKFDANFKNELDHPAYNHRIDYYLGALQAFLLDRVHPNWKQDFYSSDEDLFTLLEQRIPVRKSDSSDLFLKYEISDKIDDHKLFNRQRDFAFDSFNSSEKYLIIDLREPFPFLQIETDQTIFNKGITSLYPNGLNEIQTDYFHLNSINKPVMKMRFSYLKIPINKSIFYKQVKSFVNGSTYQDFEFKSDGIDFYASRARVTFTDHFIKISIIKE